MTDYLQKGNRVLHIGHSPDPNRIIGTVAGKSAAEIPAEQSWLSQEWYKIEDDKGGVHHFHEEDLKLLGAPQKNMSFS